MLQAALLRSSHVKTTVKVLKFLFNEIHINHQQSQKQYPVIHHRSKMSDGKPVPKLRRDKQQEAAKKKTIPSVPSTVNLQVIGAGANGSPCSLYLFTDQARYLFNCGEGTQRLAHEHKTKLPRLEQIFFTRNTWHALGGFPGLVLTIQDAGVKELSLHGPPDIEQILISMKRFVVLKTLQVFAKDCTQVQEFEDNAMTVKCLPLHGSIDKTKPPVIAYICKLKPRPGTLNLEKCVDAGVPPGPLLGLLKNGEDVTLENGRIVLSKDVSEPSETALTFMILDVPSEEYLCDLQNHIKFIQEFQNDAQSNLALIVHFTPTDMLSNNCYKSAVASLSPSAQHLYLNSADNCFSGYISAHRIQYKLNLLNSRIFPLLPESKQNISTPLKKTKLNENIENLQIKQTLTEDEQQHKTAHITALTSLTNFHLRPRKGLDRTLEAKLNANEYISETQVLPEFSLLLQQLKEKYKTIESVKTEYPKIIFLGTGSCIPNKTRNVSSILIQPMENSYLLLDCGEGTLGQIERFFGREKAEHVIRNLKVIYVSHLHADHHIGLIGLLMEYQRLHSAPLPMKPILLLAPWQIQPWLNFYDTQLERINETYKLIGNSDLMEHPLELDGNETGLTSISTCLVRHCAHAFGVALTMPAAPTDTGRSEDLNEPIKITYSGDTMPCQDLVNLGYKSTVLIHEATMEDDLIEEAKIKTHSTISQAIEQGRLMQAKYTILTHFSQRYAKMPRMQTELNVNVSIAFDNMQVTPEDLEHFHYMYPALKALFAEQAEELEQKALKRELKLERKRKILTSV